MLRSPAITSSPPPCWTNFSISSFRAAGKRFHIQIVQDHQLVVGERAVRGIGGAIDIELSRGQRLDQVGLGTRGILRDVQNFGTAQSDGAIEPDFAQVRWLESRRSGSTRPRR